jgi:metal transporter CNNM
MVIITWILIFLCLLQSAIFSGLTIGLFGLSRLRLEVEAELKNSFAVKVLELRTDSNLLLATLLWGNVGVNVLLTLLTDSIMSGASAFAFSTFLIAIFGEIAPQAYFSRHTMKIGSYLIPLIKFYRYLLYPVAKPTAHLLDLWLGKEGVMYFKERAMRVVIEKHMLSSRSDIDRIEGLGALNFLSIDDLNIKNEGSVIHPDSIIQLSFKDGYPVFPQMERKSTDPLLHKIALSGKKWVIVVDEKEKPSVAIDSDAFLRAAFNTEKAFHPMAYCHHPIIVRSSQERLGDVIKRLKVYPIDLEDDVVDEDLIIYWNIDDPDRRIITGSDLLGRLLRGIVVRME